MDFGIPDLSTGREPASDSTRRRDKAGSADFAAMLDQSLDAPEEAPREREPVKAAEPAAPEKVRERPHRPEPVETERAQAETDPSDAPAEAAAPDAAEKPAAEPREAKSEAERAPTDSPDTAKADVATASETPITPPAAPQVAAVPQPAPTGEAKAPNVAPVEPVAPLAATPQPTSANTTAAPETPANGVAQTTNVAAAQPAFAEQLANATGKPADAAPAKPKAKSEPSPVAEPAAKPAVAETTTAAAITATTAAASSDNRPQRDPANANPAAQPPVAPTPVVPPQANPAAAQASTATPAQAAQAASDPSDDAQIVAIVRAPAQPAAAPRPAAPEPGAPFTAPDDLQKALPADVKATAETTKSDTPRPFGALAPGLGLAAQITAQQTPDQANAAERLAQLAAAASEKTIPATKADADPAAPTVDEVPAALRTEQPPPVDAPTTRHAATDVNAATATARTARPTFHPVVTQVAAQVAQAAADGTDRINIRLSPAELGRIDVKLDFGPDGRVQAVFAAERPQTMELLQRDARDLERALQDAGLRADSGSLSFNLRGNGRDNRDDQTPGGSRNDGAPVDVAASQLQAYSAGSGGSGRLDIRI